MRGFRVCLVTLALALLLGASALAQVQTEEPNERTAIVPGTRNVTFEEIVACGLFPQETRLEWVLIPARHGLVPVGLHQNLPRPARELLNLRTSLIIRPTAKVTGIIVALRVHQGALARAALDVEELQAKGAGLYV